MQYNDIPKLFYDTCVERGLKITPQRALIYAEIGKAKDHPTADAIYKRVRKSLPNISFDTVYRTLLTFTEIGLVNLVEGYGEQKRFEPHVHQHHHFRCLTCRTIYDFENPAYDAIEVPRAVQKHGAVLNKRVVLEGVCSHCQDK